MEMTKTQLPNSAEVEQELNRERYKSRYKRTLWGTVFALVMRYTYQNASERQSGELLQFLEDGIQCLDKCINPDYVMVHYISDGQETTGAELY